MDTGTCIVGLIDKGKVWMGGDSLGSSGSKKRVYKNKKVFKVGFETHTLLFGYTSSFRMGQIIEYDKAAPKYEASMDEQEYLCDKYIPHLRAVFTETWSNKVKSDECGGTFLIGFNGRLFSVHSNYAVLEAADNFTSCGCGEDFAYGSLYTTRNSKLTPKERIKLSLEAAEHFSSGVARPFIILSA